MANEPSLDRLTRRFLRLLASATNLEVVGFRSTSPKYATSEDILSGEGSRQFGGRWNPVGVAAVYASLSPETAMAETLAHQRYYGLPLSAAMPRVFVALQIQLAAVIDLNDGAVRNRLRVSQKTLLDCKWREESRVGTIPITQRVGQAASDAGFEAVILPSAAMKKGRNIVVFPSNLRPGSLLAVDKGDPLQRCG